jgi:hypothetical protein
LEERKRNWKPLPDLPENAARETGTQIQIFQKTRREKVEVRR